MQLFIHALSWLVKYAPAYTLHDYNVAVIKQDNDEKIKFSLHHNLAVSSLLYLRYSIVYI